MKTAGLLCLQGGRELTKPCETMDAAVLARANGRVVVIAGAARVGSDYAGASARTVAHYGRLGAEVDVVPDPRTDARAALAALSDGVGLAVLPGGSPGSLLDVLTSVDGGSIGTRLVELWRSGTAISGASAERWCCVPPPSNRTAAEVSPAVSGSSMASRFPIGRQVPSGDGHSPTGSSGASPNVGVCSWTMAE